MSLLLITLLSFGYAVFGIASVLVFATVTDLIDLRDRDPAELGFAAFVFLFWPGFAGILAVTALGVGVGWSVMTLAQFAESRLGTRR